MPQKFDMSFFKDEQGNQLAKYKNLILSSVFQPIFDQNNEVVGAEALLRMQDQDGERVCPGYYFSDENPNKDDKLAIDLVSRILHINNFGASQQQSHIKLFLNFLPNNLKNADKQCIHEIQFLTELQKHNVNSEQIVLEVLELHCDNIEQLQASVQKMSQQGFDIAIDDFGAKYSNSERAELIKPSIVKIDRMVLEQYMQGDQETLLEAMEIAKAHGAKTVIEGIETQEQLDMMKTLNIDMYQGFYLGMPAPLTPAA